MKRRQSAHLDVPVVFGFGFVEDGQRPCDDQTQFLVDSEALHTVQLWDLIAVKQVVLNVVAASC